MRGPGGLAAVALVSYPCGWPSPPELGVIQEETWGELGVGARRRYGSFGAATAGLGVEAEYIHLNMIGVRRSAQGLGLGRTVMDAVHDVSASNPSSTGVTLSTALESNVPLYEHFGYKVVECVRSESAFTT